MFQENFVEEFKNTHFMINNFFFENPVFYEIIRENSVQRGRPQMGIWRTHIASWIPEATNTQSEYVILNSFFFCNHGYTKVPQCYVIYTVLPLFYFLFLKYLGPNKISLQSSATCWTRGIFLEKTRIFSCIFQ